MPTIVFQPAFGQASITQDNGSNLVYPNRVNVPNLYLIFRGSGWTQASQQSVVDATNNFLASGFLSGLAQYGADAVPVLRNSTNVLYSFDDPVTNDSIHDTVNEAIDDDNVPDEDNNIYEVVTSANVGGDTQNNSLGFNGVITRFDPIIPEYLPFFWASYGQNLGIPNVTGLDEYTKVLSHELTELKTDPADNGLEVAQSGYPGPIGGLPTAEEQICDNEANEYGYRVPDLSGNAGIVVQPFWSNADHAWIVPDGSPNKQITLQPNWSTGTNNYTYSLSITANSSVSLSAGTNGGLQVTVDGETANFDGQIDPLSSITINTGIAKTSIDVSGLPKGLPAVTITGSGKINVQLHSRGDIAGSVTILDPAATLHLADAPTGTTTSSGDALGLSSVTLPNNATGVAITGVGDGAISVATSGNDEFYSVIAPGSGFVQFGSATLDYSYFGGIEDTASFSSFTYQVDPSVGMGNYDLANGPVVNRLQTDSITFFGNADAPLSFANKTTVDLGGSEIPGVVGLNTNVAAAGLRTVNIDLNEVTFGADDVQIHATPSGVTTNINKIQQVGLYVEASSRQDGVQDIHGIVYLNDGWGGTQLTVDDSNDGKGAIGRHIQNGDPASRPRGYSPGQRHECKVNR